MLFSLRPLPQPRKTPAVPYLVRSAPFSKNGGEIRAPVGNHLTEAPWDAGGRRLGLSHGLWKAARHGFVAHNRATCGSKRLEGGASQRTASVERSRAWLRRSSPPQPRETPSVPYLVRSVLFRVNPYGIKPRAANNLMAGPSASRRSWRVSPEARMTEGPPPVSCDGRDAGGFLCFRCLREPPRSAAYQVWYEVHYLRPFPEKGAKSWASAAISTTARSRRRRPVQRQTERPTHRT